MLEEPLNQTDTKALLITILKSGEVSYSKHALEELAKDTLETTDVVNVLRAGYAEPAEFENGSWRYRIRTSRIAVVVAFRSNTEVRVVTAWRFKS